MNLLDGITATAATKEDFTLNSRDFQENSVPMLKASGLGSGDSILIWEWVNEAWTDTGVTLESDQTSRIVDGLGKYAVTAILATAGPVSCDINTSRQ
jgi:hypothetical protein